jgi:hypothetical protein
MAAPMSRLRIYDAINNERARQEKLYPGQETIADGTGSQWNWLEHFSRNESADELKSGKPSSAVILLEEVAEALAAENNTDLETELVQVASVCVQWLERLQARTGGK